MGSESDNLSKSVVLVWILVLVIRVDDFVAFVLKLSKKVIY